VLSESYGRGYYLLLELEYDAVFFQKKGKNRLIVNLTGSFFLLLDSGLGLPFFFSDAKSFVFNFLMDAFCVDKSSQDFVSNGYSGAFESLTITIQKTGPELDSVDLYKSKLIMLR
jgi:hypothetical protein